MSVKWREYFNVMKWRLFEGKWTRKMQSDCNIRLSGRDESDEGLLSGYSPGRDLNRIYLGHKVRFICVDLPKLFIRILKIYERSKTHSLFFFTVFFKHVGSVEMILSLPRDRLSSD